MDIIRWFCPAAVHFFVWIYLYFMIEGRRFPGSFRKGFRNFLYFSGLKLLIVGVAHIKNRVALLLGIAVIIMKRLCIISLLMLLIFQFSDVAGYAIPGLILRQIITY